MFNVYVERNECQYRDFINERNEWSSNGAERCEVKIIKSRTGVYYYVPGNYFIPFTGTSRRNGGYGK